MPDTRISDDPVASALAGSELLAGVQAAANVHITAAQIATYVNSLLGTASLLASDTDGTLAADSDTRVATQKAVKTYVNSLVTGLLDFKGSTDCSANPNYPVASKGDAYYVSVAGKIGGASGKSVEIGDVYVASADNAGGTEAAVGTSWFVLEHNLVGAAVTSGTLAQFTATTSAQLAGVISDETGTGVLVFGTGPTFTNSITVTGGNAYTITNSTGGGFSGMLILLNGNSRWSVGGDVGYGEDFYIINTQTGAQAIRINVTTSVVTFGAGITVALAKPITIPAGTNKRAGNATLVAGTITVSNTTVTDNTIVLLTRKTSGGTIGTAVTYTVSTGSGFTISTDNILDTSTFSYMLIENP